MLKTICNRQVIKNEFRLTGSMHAQEGVFRLEKFTFCKNSTHCSPIH